MSSPTSRPLLAQLAGVKPGWYVLVFLLLYSLVATVLLVVRQPAQPAAIGPAPTVVTPSTAAAERNAGTPGADERGDHGHAGLWFPVPGAKLPASDSNLPGAARSYRHGVSQGFDFFGVDAGVPLGLGTPVIASASGQIVRADVAYTEIDPRAWDVLLADVADGGADESQLDQLRGRQVWLRLADGTVLRYGHLDAVREGIRTGASVYRGQVIGFVGNSGTDNAVAGRKDQPRLRFEVWLPDGSFFGNALEAEAVRMAAASLFVGP